MISDISVNSFLIDEDNSIINSPLTISTKSESSTYISQPLPPLYSSSLYESFPYLYYATPSYAKTVMDEETFPAAKRMRYDSPSTFAYPPIPVDRSYMNHLPPSYYLPYSYPPNTTLPTAPPSSPVSPTLTEDSLDSILSDSVEDEAEVWKDVLTFYCGEISTTEEIDGASIIMDGMMDEEDSSSNPTIINSYSI